MGEIITKENEQIVRFFKTLDRITKGLESMAGNHKPQLGGERYLTDFEVSKKLRVSRRTLQEWRNNGQIAYLLLGGKVLYAESDIQTMLEKCHRKAWE